MSRREDVAFSKLEWFSVMRFTSVEIQNILFVLVTGSKGDETMVTF